MGRPTKYTKERAQVIYDAIVKGYYAEDAAALAGIGESTYYRWLEEHSEFRESIATKTAECQQKPLQAIMAAIEEGNVDASFKFLARRFPQQWGEKAVTKVEQSGTITHSGRFQFDYEPKAELALAQIEAGSEGNSE